MKIHIIMKKKPLKREGVILCILKLTGQKGAILDYISENSEITLEEVQKLLNIKETRTYVVMKQLLDYGKVEKSDVVKICT